MSERALKAAPGDQIVADPEDVLPESPGSRLLDALRAGDDKAVLAAVGQATTVTAENMPWACRGPDEVATMLREARERFPGLTFESTARHVGFGIVIEEARVRDAGDEAEASAEDTESSDEPDPETPAADSSRHPMWDVPETTRRELMVWRDQPGLDEAAAPLNMPVRLTVKHDDLQVHEVTFSFPAALLKRALGVHVDPLEMSLSEVQSAFIAPVGVGFATHRLARPDLGLTAPSETEPAAVVPNADERPPRRRRRLLVLLVLAVLAVGAGAGWWVLQGPQASASATPPVSQTPTASPSATQSPSAQASPSQQPHQGHGSPVRSRKPNVTLKSDLAFGFDSAQLSGAAKQAIAQLGHQVQKSHLTGTIYVDGYTDSIGSASYGKTLSQQRADAVAGYLRSHLGGAKVTVVPVGHGEADPIASNATAAGQKQNRRVTITLPKA